MGKEKSFHDPYYIFSLYNGFHLPKGWYLNLSFSYRSSGTYDFVTISSVHNFDFQLYKSFLKDRLSLSLNVSDIFNTRRQKTDGTYGNVRFQQQKWEDTRSVQLRLTYRFNQAKKQYRGENSAQEAVGRMGGKQETSSVSLEKLLFLEKLSRFKYRKTKSLLSRISMILPQQRLFFEKGL